MREEEYVAFSELPNERIRIHGVVRRRVLISSQCKNFGTIRTPKLVCFLPRQ